MPPSSMARTLSAIEARSRSGHALDRLRNDRNGDEFKTVEQAQAGWATESAGAIGEKYKRNRRRHGETSPCRESAAITGAHKPDRKPNLARRRTRQKLAERHEIGIRLLVEPSPAYDKFLAEVPDVSNWPAKAAHAEFAECEQHFPRRARPIIF